MPIPQKFRAADEELSVQVARSSKTLEQSLPKADCWGFTWARGETAYFSLPYRRRNR